MRPEEYRLARRRPFAARRAGHTGSVVPRYTPQLGSSRPTSSCPRQAAVSKPARHHRRTGDGARRGRRPHARLNALVNDSVSLPARRPEAAHETRSPEQRLDASSRNSLSSGHAVISLTTAALLTVSLLVGSLTPALASSTCTGDNCAIVDTVSTPAGPVTVTATAAHVLAVTLAPLKPDTLVIGVPFTFPEPPITSCPGGCSRARAVIPQTAGPSTSTPSFGRQ